MVPVKFIECYEKTLQYILVLDQAANTLLKLLKVLQTSSLSLQMYRLYKVSRVAEQLACVCLVVLYSFIYFLVL